MRIEAIWGYPVKSMAGARLDAAEPGRLGVPGDRVAYVLVRAEKRTAHIETAVCRGLSASDGTRTRDLRRDRPAL